MDNAPVDRIDHKYPGYTQKQLLQRICLPHTVLFLFFWAAGDFPRLVLCTRTPLTQTSTAKECPDSGLKNFTVRSRTKVCIDFIDNLSGTNCQFWFLESSVASLGI